jgi:hypothetical protein
MGLGPGGLYDEVSCWFCWLLRPGTRPCGPGAACLICCYKGGDFVLLFGVWSGFFHPLF